jgi:GPH family glycoside/pentoside/hexuronide:cation symporter
LTIVERRRLILPLGLPQRFRAEPTPEAGECYRSWMAQPPPEERIPTERILTYSTPLITIFLSNALLGLYLLKFATDVVLIAPAVIATILLVARIWDAVSDPLAGYLSDRTVTRWGRRRPWFAVSALPLGLAIVALWSPPEGLGEAALGAWFAAAVLLYYTAYTCFRVPHMAMGAELSRGYHDRTRVFGVMQVIETVGMLLGALTLFLLEQAEDQRAFARGMSVAIAIGTVSFIWTATVRIQERGEFQGRGGASPISAFRDVLSNPHSRLLVAIFFVEQLGFAAVIALLPYISDYVIETPGSTAIYAGSAICAVMVSVPFWVAIARRVGKQRVWFVSLLLKIAVLAGFFTLGSGDFWLLIAGTIGFGVFTGAGAVVGPSLKADVVDWDEARTGERKEGAYFASWNFAQKAAGGIAIWIVGSMLAMTGYVPNVVQTEDALTGIRLLYSTLPAGLNVAAAVLVYRFSLDEAAHRKARIEAAGRSGASVTKP